jgi:hypothetical protein
MHFSFRIDIPGLERTAFLIERTILDASGDLETEFLENAGPLTRHRGKSIGELAVALASDPGIEVLAVSRNPALVLDPGLPARVAEAREMLAPLAGCWSLAAAGGMTPLGGRVCALYSSETPFIPAHRSPQPLSDPLPDLYLTPAAAPCPTAVSRPCWSTRAISTAAWRFTPRPSPPESTVRCARATRSSSVMTCRTGLPTPLRVGKSQP